MMVVGLEGGYRVGGWVGTYMNYKQKGDGIEGRHCLLPLPSSPCK